MMRLLKNWYFSLFSLLLFSGAALADPSSSNAVTQKTDLSIAYLSSFFGTVSGVLTGTSGQMFGTIMYQFNQGVLIAAACYLIFTVITVVFKAVAHGTFNHQDNKVILIILRIALGFSLLICQPSTGYTPLQGIIMKVVVQGVKLADQIWDYGLDYLNSGGALWSRPVQQRSTNSPDVILSSNDQNKILGTTSTYDVNNNWDSLSMIQKIMGMEACMIQSAVDSDGAGDTLSVSDNFTIQEDLDRFKFSFPGKPGASCGSVNWDTGVNKTYSGCTAGSSGDDHSQCGYSHLALKEVIYDLLPSVKKYVCIANETSGNLKDAGVCEGINSDDQDTTYMTDAMFNATLGFKNLIDPVVRADAVPPSSNDALSFVSQAKKDGWLTAGRYYWDIMRIEASYDNSLTGKANYSSYIPNNYLQPNTGFNYDSPASLITATGGDRGYINTVDNQISAYTGAAASGQGAKSMPSGGQLKWLLQLLMPMVSELVGLIMAFSTKLGPLGLGPEPILWLHNIGMSCLSLGMELWIGTGLALFALVTATSICSAVNSLGIGIKATMDWFQPVLLAAGAGFFAIGLMLGFYNPIHPYMVFTFGIINWLIQVIYAIVAGSLVAMGMTFPEGHDFLGAARQFPMLLLTVFFRPALMVVGLFAGMILCQAISSLLLYTYSGFMSDIFYVKAPITGAPSGDILLNSVGIAMGRVMGDSMSVDAITAPLVALFVFPIMLGIFTLTIYTTTTICFSLIYEVADYVMDWIGAPRPHSINANQLADQVKHGFSGGAGKLAEAGTRSRLGNGDDDATLKANKP